MSSNDDRKTKTMDPLAITESLGFKTFRKTNRNTWLPEEDAQLTAILAEKYQKEGLKGVNADEVDWDAIASKLYKDGSRKSKELKKRWTTSLDPNLRKGKWTKAEDEQLIQAFNRYGPSWQKVAASIKTRTMDQCAKRYTEVLDPKTKDRLIPWTREEELLLIKQVRIHGTKWRTVASNFKGRPSLTCRNRWRKIVINVVRGKADPVIQKEVESITNKGVVLPKNNSPESTTSNFSAQSSPNFEEYEKKQTPYQHRKPEPEAERSEVEWKYVLSSANGADVSKLPHSQLFDANGGTIKDESLVQALVQYAKTNNLNISVHQHMHHHYAPPPPPFVAAQAQKFSSNGFPYASSSPSGIFGVNANGNAPLFDGSPSQTAYPKSNGSYYLEPEATLNRFQHFNYLPPLTEVPKLTSSNSPPHSTSSKDRGVDNRDNEKTDFTKMLNDGFKREASPMTPLTQAVEIAAAAEANYNKRPHHASSNETASMKTKLNSNSTVKSMSDDEEEGMDFWEQMRNLSELPSNNTHQQPSTTQKPVSQHHPLHYFMGSVTPQPQSRHGEADDHMEEDEEEMDDEFRNHRMFYKSFPDEELGELYETENSTSRPDDSTANSVTETQTRVYDNLISNFGVIPFNPS